MSLTVDRRRSLEAESHLSSNTDSDVVTNEVEHIQPLISPHDSLSQLEEDPLAQASSVAQESQLHSEGAHTHREARFSVDLRGLFISHFLSTWNARTYEFAAVVFTVDAFPKTLLPASISGIAQCITSILLSPTVGSFADRNPSRLNALKTTILVQRCAVLAACAFWSFLLWSSDDQRGSQPEALKWSVFMAIVSLSCIERLAAGGNLVVMERDWVPTLAPAVGESSLHILNATMRRIDLICKVLAPGFVTLLSMGFSAIPATAPHNVFWTALAIACMSVASPWAEWISAQRVWNSQELLQAPKIYQRERAQVNEAESGERNWLQYVRDKMAGLIRFLQSAVLLPTVSIALMYLSVLTFSSPMITFLLNSGFSLTVVTVARLFSSLLEVSATAVMPWGVKTIRNRPAKDWRPINEEEIGFLEEELPEPSNIDKAEVERVGLWAAWWMAVALVPAVYGVLGLTATSPATDTGLPSPYFSLPMLLGVSLSRVGLWTFDLAYSQLQQTLPPPALRGEFTGIEQSFISTAELLQWALTAVMSKPEEFNILAIVSWFAVLGAAGCYAWFIRQRRGHLLHVKVSSCCKN